MRTIDPFVIVFRPYADVLSLKQCAAVSMTVGDNRVAEHAKTPLSAYATYGWLFPSGWPPMIAPADVGRTANSTATRATKVNRKVTNSPSREASGLTLDLRLGQDSRFSIKLEERRIHA